MSFQPQGQITCKVGEPLVLLEAELEVTPASRTFHLEFCIETVVSSHACFLSFTFLLFKSLEVQCFSQSVPRLKNQGHLHSYLSVLNKFDRVLKVIQMVNSKAVL